MNWLDSVNIESDVIARPVNDVLARYSKAVPRAVSTKEFVVLMYGELGITVVPKQIRGRTVQTFAYE